MRHFEEDEEPHIGNKKIYINYSRSRSIEPRDGNISGSSGGAGGTNGASGGSSPRVVSGAGGADGSTVQDAASPYAHLIMEDHAKLLGLASFYLQTYG